MISPRASPASDARSAVMVVPTFAPSVTGKIFSMRTTPAPARGTSKEVVTELL